MSTGTPSAPLAPELGVTRAPPFVHIQTLTHFKDKDIYLGK